jgi:hypothetical protein
VPPARHDAAMVYDSLRNNVWLFGGNSNSAAGLLGDLWRFDGNDWLEIHLTNPPSPRAGTAFAFDARRGKMVIFGKGTLLAGSNDTWEFDGAVWKQILTAHAPSVRDVDAMTYDSGRGTIVLFGGVDFLNGPRNDTWEYDGSDWTERHPIHQPPARKGDLAFDEGRDKVVLILGGLTGGMREDVWEYDGADWNLVSTPNPLSSREGTTMVFDASQHGLFLFGGTDQRTTELSDSWILSYERSGFLPDRCAQATIDSDGDSMFGCGALALDDPATPIDERALRADPDCASRCTPSCAPTTTANDATTMTSVAWPASCAIAHPGAPRCGDAICDPPREDYLLCPQDCLTP